MYLLKCLYCLLCFGYHWNWFLHMRIIILMDCFIFCCSLLFLFFNSSLFRFCFNFLLSLALFLLFGGIHFHLRRTFLFKIDNNTFLCFFDTTRSCLWGIDVSDLLLFRRWRLFDVIVWNYFVVALHNRRVLFLILLFLVEFLLSCIWIDWICWFGFASR